MNRIAQFFANGSERRSWSGIILIRLLVGWVFVLAGLGKFMDLAGTEQRFEGIGLPAPAFTAGFVAFFELVCGALVLLGLFTRAAAIPLAIIMVVALVTTKVPQFTDGNIINALSASRLDVSLLLASLFLLWAGGGRFAADRSIGGR
jgi:putative oxidoreductase